jgi:ketosteroid isomerase-like protein
VTPAGTLSAPPAENALYAFLAALSDGDVTIAAACFTREGCMITPDGTAVHGRPEVSRILAQLVARRTEIEVAQLVVRPAGDVALATGRLTLRSDGPDRERIEQTCELNLALRLIEGTWKIAILSPWASLS